MNDLQNLLYTMFNDKDSDGNDVTIHVPMATTKTMILRRIRLHVIGSYYFIVRNYMKTHLYLKPSLFGIIFLTMDGVHPTNFHKVGQAEVDGCFM